jgi:hypothetical protein
VEEEKESGKEEATPVAWDGGDVFDNYPVARS